MQGLMMKRKSARAERWDWTAACLAGVGLLVILVAGQARGAGDEGSGAGDEGSGAGLAGETAIQERGDLYDMSLVPRKIRTVVFRAAAYGKAGQPQRAVELLQEHLKEHPDQDHYLVRLHLAQNLGDAGRTAESLEHYRAAVDLEPRLERGWYGLADAAYDLQQYDLAGEAFHRGYLAAPDRPDEVLFYAATAYLQAERPGDAWPLFTRLTSGASGASGASGTTGAVSLKWYQGLVAAAVRMEQPDLAGPAVERMLVQFPDDPDAWYLKYQWSVAGGDFRAAAVALSVVGFLRSLDQAEQKQLGDLFSVIQVPHLASRHYRAGLKETAGAEDFERLASSLVAAHEIDQALAVLQTALTGTETPRLISLLGDIQYLRKDYEAAMAAFARLSAMDPAQGRGWLMQGYCALELGRRDQALDLLARASNYEDQAEMAQLLIQRALRMEPGAGPGAPSELQF